MEGLSQNEKIIWKCWDDKSPRDVVREAAAKGTYINLAIKYLMAKNSWNETTAKDWFTTEVKAWTVQLLAQKQIFKVLHVLNKCNINAEDHLMALAKVATEIDYRDFIVEHLEKLTKDTVQLDRWADFKRHWNLLRHLEKSFEVDGTFKQNKVFGIAENRVFVNESEIKALNIEKIEQYPADWKCKVATVLFFDTFEFSLLDFCTPIQMWNYLIEQNKAMVLVRWINIQMSEVVRDMNARYNFFNGDSFVQKLLHIDTKGFQSEVLDTLDEIFRKWPISSEMIASVSKSKHCFDYTKMCIYDTLSSYGIIVDEEKKDLIQIISRLVRTQNLRIIDEIFSESCATISKREFYLELAKYCVKNKLYKMLTLCFEDHIRETDLSDVEQSVKGCIELWLLFKSIERTSDRQSHVVPVYKTCQQIAQNDIDEYISSNPYLVLGMILLEDNAKLFDIFSKNEFLQFKDFKLPNKRYDHKLPHLFNIYKKYNMKNCMYEPKDVNVYQLLSGYRGLDVSKIFEFQIMNMSTNNSIPDKTDRRSLGSLISHEVDVRDIKPLTQRGFDMPDFDNEKLIKRYGYEAKLNHIYYLKQYRPCNASQAFVSQQYLTFNRLQEKSVKSACCEAHALALLNWYDPAMAACCISFVAMIGCNPTRCRVHMSAAKMIESHLMRKGIPENEANKIIGDLMSQLIQSNDSAAKVILENLEDITMAKLKDMKENNNYDMSIVLYESQTMVKFAMLHNLPLPEKQLRAFVKENSWFNFLLFGDVFRYPLNQMLQLSQEFEKRSYAEHLKYIMVHRTVEDDKDQKSVSSNGHRKLSRLSSGEVSPTQSMIEWRGAWLGRELWEVAAACHGPEDPPAALLRAAHTYREPLLVLLASCYEPNAIDTLWAQWILSGIELRVHSREALLAEISQLSSARLLQRIAEVCLLEGYLTTLHESILIFMQDSPLVLLTSFLHRCVNLRAFDNETRKHLTSFINYYQRKYSMDTNGFSWDLSKESLQNIAVSLIKIALEHCFDSAYHQRELLKCLKDVSFEKDLLVPSPNFSSIYDIVEISMKTSLVVNISRIMADDGTKYLQECIEKYTSSAEYSVATNIAKLTNLPVDEILITEWSRKFSKVEEDMALAEDDVQEKSYTLFLAQTSEAFKEAGVSFANATDFLLKVANSITDDAQKFYAYRIIVNWFTENHEYGEKRESIEHKMWDSYFVSSESDLFLGDAQSTLYYVMNNQKLFEDKQTDNTFAMTLQEIEVESDIMNIENVVLLEKIDDINSFRAAVNRLLELKLVVEAFRLSALYKISECEYRPLVCPVQIMRTCLKLAEGTLSPYELPAEIRLVISSPKLQNKLSGSQSETSFEELVVIAGCEGEAGSLAARHDADTLATIDALAVRTGFAPAKQVASYFRIALQIGWDYVSVLKNQNRPLDFINLVSGRARMSLANLVFRTFNVPSKQIAEYLCRELVAAIISPHLVKTSTFRQKEHFQYTLWGYVLDSDMEMFLNMRPDSCSHIGRLILDHLMAFQKIYKVTNPTQSENVLDDSNLDVETLIDEEYQNIEGDEIESILTEEGTLMSAETESVYSVASLYAGNKQSRESRRNLFDVITKSNIHIRYEIKSNIRKITKGAKLSTKQVNIICIELLVVAHECFTSACDTEGVAVALRSAQALAARLLAARSWRLMVRLLTGLARYTECAYILQALRENHQFEFLLGQFDYMLGQQQDKITEFKHGLLDFLKTHCPGDTDTYIMVALHFNMYAEAANVKKKQALALINDLEKMAGEKASPKKSNQPVWLQIHDNVPTRTMLETALNHCTDAAELYLQGGCTGFAGEMAMLAQQIALQMSLLNASPTRLILNRTTGQLYTLISEYLSFMEGLVAGASHGAAWRELAYRRALTNDQRYIRDCVTYRPDVAAYFLDRYNSEKNKTPQSKAAMTDLRSLLR
ncbi:spatacsin [Aricia agestis]|uniref:spatacsin n=1 Tax=Aricia agestis TaxID=91739 RepID=UPI001C20BAB6|nr:spatacsin [Aricia agestis]XP_041977838.1 spatacsin [Aricia agestis]